MGDMEDTLGMPLAAEEPASDLESLGAQERPEVAQDVEVSSSQSVQATLVALSDHSKGRRAAARARRIFLRDAQISFVVAAWTVLLSAPVVVYPIAQLLWDMGCVGLEQKECIAHDYCRWFRTSQFFFWKGTCQTSRRGFLNLWGAMILQFVFSVYTDFGSSIKFTLQGAFGTFLAWINVTVLNTLLAPLLGMGAHGDPIVPESGTLPLNSRWMPLCNDGFQVLTGDTQPFCFLNLWCNQVSVSGLFKLFVVMADFVLFVIVSLHVGFDSNTRMFALSTHVYFMMAFVNPNADDFSHFPTTADTYCLMILAASSAAVLCFLVPTRRFTAAEKADSLAEEAVDAVSVLLHSLHGTPAQLMRQKARSALDETEVALADLQEVLDSAWFEDFGVGLAATRRRRLQKLVRSLHACLRHVPATQHAAEALSPADAQALEQHLPELRGLCAAARDLVLGLCGHGSGSGSAGAKATPCMDARYAELSLAFEVARGALSGKACAFVLAVVGVAADAAGAAQDFGGEDGPRQLPRGGRCGCCARAAGIARTVSRRFGMRTGDREATHPRFVLRNTFSISLAFLIGWGGLWNVLPAYSSYPSSTICVIFCTYAGSSAPVTVRRVAGVVIGKVIGTGLQLGFAVKAPVKATAFAVTMWASVGCMFFMYLHAGKEIAYVCCLAAAFAASSMIPANCRFREWGDTDYTDIIPGLMTSIVSTVIGVAILSLVDFFLASRATNQARQRLLRAIQRAARLVAAVPLPGEGGWDFCESHWRLLMEDVNALREVIPYAAAEPMYWRPPFKVELYEAMERHLRALADDVQALSWAAADCGRDLQGSATPAGASGSGALGLGGGAAPAHGLDGRPSTAAGLGALLQQWRSEVLAMVTSIAELAASVTNSGQQDDGAEEVRRQLHATLYTVRAMRLIADGVSNSMGRVLSQLRHPEGGRSGQSSSSLVAEGGDPRASFGIVARAGGSLRGKARELYHQVVHEELRPDGGAEMQTNKAVASASSPASSLSLHLGHQPDPQASAAAGPPGPTLAELVEQLREAAARQRSPSPVLDGPCRSELVALFANLVLLEAQRMQLALLEY